MRPRQLTLASHWAIIDDSHEWFANWCPKIETIEEPDEPDHLLNAASLREQICWRFVPTLTPWRESEVCKAMRI